jgi:glutamate decarboxylase
VAQYYNFIRLGRQGYRDVMQALAETASWLAAEIEALGPFEMLGRGTDLPVVCFRLAGSPPFTVFDLSDTLRQRGWIVPAYAMAPDAEDIAVLRIVVREGLSADMAAELVSDIRAALEHLEAKTATPVSVAAAKPAGAPGGRGGRRARGRPSETNKAKKTRAIC